MAICLVQKDTDSSQLKTLLAKLGYGPILVSDSVEESSTLAIIDKDFCGDFTKEKDCLEKLPPYLTVGSHSETSAGYLKKPFGKAHLGKAIRRILFADQKRRKIIYVLSNHFDWLKTVPQAYWKAVHCLSDPKAFLGLINEKPHSCGALLIDPTTPQNFDWLGVFKKTPKGARTLVCCLSRDPQLDKRLRTHCQLFFEPSLLPENWRGLFKMLALRNVYQMTFRGKRNQPPEEGLLLLFHSNIREVKALLKEDPFNPFLFDWLGGLLWKRKKQATAIEQWLHSIEINPFRAHPYVQLIRAYQMKPLPHLLSVIQQAPRYCRDDSKLMKLYATSKGSG